MLPHDSGSFLSFLGAVKYASFSPTSWCLNSEELAIEHLFKGQFFIEYIFMPCRGQEQTRSNFHRLSLRLALEFLLPFAQRIALSLAGRGKLWGLV